MSEYTPITGELREYATVAWDPWPEARDRLCQMCDAIDSIHAQLERENAALKAELDRVLGEQEEHAHTRGESITDELRKWGYGFCGDTHDVVTAIADRIDAEYERVRAESIIDMTDESMAEHGWVRLPVDADWVPIRVGDALVEGKANPQKAESLMLDYDGWSVNFGLGWCVAKYHKWHHVKPDTWERIIADAVAMGIDGVGIDARPLVERCKALCERTKEDA